MQAFFCFCPLTIINKEKEGGKAVRLSELSGKEIVDVRRAERLGVLGQTDLEINEQTGQIQALLIPTGKWFGFRKEGSEIRVPWKYIKKIGADMVIIDFPDE
jgi:YlmC/YmxH family sporulation protein